MVGTRVIPLVVSEQLVSEAETVSRRHHPLIAVKPFESLQVGMITTGSEVFLGRIKDRFGPVVRKKFQVLGSRIIRPGGFELTARGLAHCRLAPGARVLDVGCGTGAAVDFLRQRHGLSVVGLDFSAVIAGRRGPHPWRVAPGAGSRQPLPMADGCCGAVLSECVLSLCPDPLHVLGEMRRVLQPGGYLVLTDIYA